MTYDAYSEQMYALLFSVRRSIRYHDRREAFYVGLHKATSFICILFGSATVAAFAGKLGSDTGMVLAMIVTVVSAFDLVVGFTARASLHNRLRRAFIELEADIVRAPDDTHYNGYVTERLKIEQDEPPKYHALDILCHNDVVAASYTYAEAKKHLVRVGGLQRLTAHWASWGGIAHGAERYGL